MAFQYNAKSLFITYSQCPAPRQVLLDHLKERCGSDASNQLMKWVIGQESHEDGNKHLHACIFYTHELRFRRADYLDLTFEGNKYHPNIKGKRIQRKEQATKYCMKEDPEPLEGPHPWVKDENDARKGHHKIVTQLLIRKEKPMTIRELIEDEQMTLIEAPKWEAGLALYNRLSAENKADLGSYWPLNTRWTFIDPVIVQPISCKRRHLWIWSAQPNAGKTWFVKHMRDNHRCAIYNKRETFQNFPVNTQVIIIDEYSFPTLRATEINEMCDGTVQYPAKGC